MHWTSKTAFLVVALAGSTGAAALEQYLPYIPNSMVNRCGNCHLSPNGGGTRTPFGNDVRMTRVGGVPSWAAVYALDSDGDGFTNGEELGDPCGVWMRGAAPTFTTDITLPGDDTSVPAAHTADTCAAGSSSSSGGGGGSSGMAGSSSSSGGTTSSGEASSSGGGGGGGGCCGAADNSTARLVDVGLVTMFGLILRRRRR